MDNQNVKKRSPSLVILFITVIVVWTALLGVVMFNRYVFMTLPLGIRMVLAFVEQWAVLFVPIILMVVTKTRLSDLGFSRDKIGWQIVIGMVLAVIMSLFLTLTPILCGFEESIVGTHYQFWWQFVYDLVQKIFAVALMEEVIFRGFIYKLLLDINGKEWFAIVVSSVLFGFFHIFNGNIFQVITTAFIGFVFCVCRNKIKGCTLLSLIIMHGVYDWLIPLWGYLL